MTKHTPEQEEFFLHGLESRESLLLEAVAGSGKTYTLLELLGLLAESGKLQRTMICAFNKHIQVEFEQKLIRMSEQPGREALRELCQVRTLNGIGHSAFGRFLGKKLVLETNKLYSAANELFGRGSESPLRTSDFRKLVDAARMFGIVPAGSPGQPINDSDQTWVELFEAASIDSEDFAPEYLIHCARQTLARMNRLAWQGVIDFADQLYLPIAVGGKFETFPLVLVDEAQDLGWINHQMLAKLLGPSGRLIAAGDRYQAIYGFRGADTRSIPNMIEKFKLKPLPLTVSFRCPKAVVAEAQAIVPHIRAADSAPQGDVWKNSKLAALRAGDFVLCRYNKPLVLIWLRLLKRGQPAKIIGKDIGETLAKLFLKRGCGGNRDMLLSRARVAFHGWAQGEFQVLSSKGKESQAAAVLDKADAIECIAESAPSSATFEWFAARIEQMFGSAAIASLITLSTIHKAKGLEFPRVHFLGREVLPPKFAKGPGAEQEQNLIYVGITRAQQELFYLPLNQLKDPLDLNATELLAPDEKEKLPSYPSLAEPSDPAPIPRDEELRLQEEFLEQRAAERDAIANLTLDDVLGRDPTDLYGKDQLS